jgi:hypothetical protein
MSTPPLPDLPTPTMVAELVASLGFTVVRERLGLQLPPAPSLNDDTALIAFVDETPWARARLASLYRWQQRRALGRGRRRHGDDLRGLGTAVVTATTNVTDVVQGVHDAIGAVPIITDLVYRAVRGVTNLVGSGVDVVVASLTPFLGDSAPGLQREAVVAALNGVVGDHLAATNNPLALHMALRPPLDGWHDGQVLLVMVHGSSASDMQWRWEGHDHGVALAMELGFTPLYAHYNSGLHVSDNGAQLAAMLEQEAGPFREVIVLAHSMGGLVSRSALQAGAVAGHSWRTKVRVLVTLGSPHEGAPLERSGNVFESLLGVTPWTSPLQALARVRSAGITDAPRQHRRGRLARPGPLRARTRPPHTHPAPRRPPLLRGRSHWQPRGHSLRGPRRRQPRAGAQRPRHARRRAVPPALHGDPHRLRHPPPLAVVELHCLRPARRLVGGPRPRAPPAAGADFVVVVTSPAPPTDLAGVA